MLVESPKSRSEEITDRSDVSSIRGLEAEVLLRAVTALRLDGILSEVEYQAKRQRLVAQL